MPKKVLNKLLWKEDGNGGREGGKEVGRGRTNSMRTDVIQERENLTQNKENKFTILCHLLVAGKSFNFCVPQLLCL